MPHKRRNINEHNTNLLYQSRKRPRNQGLNERVSKSKQFEINANTSQSDAALLCNPRKTKFDGIQATNEKAKVALRVARASGI